MNDCPPKSLERSPEKKQYFFCHVNRGNKHLTTAESPFEIQSRKQIEWFPPASLSIQKCELFEVLFVMLSQLCRRCWPIHLLMSPKSPLEDHLEELVPDAITSSLVMLQLLRELMVHYRKSVVC